MGRQILIDAQILEVKLDDAHRTGVNWSYLNDKIGVSFGVTQAITTASTAFPVGSVVSSIAGSTLENTLAGGSSGFTLSGSDGKSTYMINLLKEFGDVRSLSNPTIRAKHGKPAMISVGTTNTYVSETDTTTTTTGGSTVTEIEVETDTVFDGLMLGVQPFINPDGRVTLTVNPIQSDVAPSSLALIDVGGETKVTLPQVDLKELSTVLEINDNDTVILGGLIDKSAGNTRVAVPVLSEIPLFGRAFTENAETEIIRELVLVLKVSIL